MNGKYLFDTNAIVYYLQGRPEWVDFIDSTVMTERAASVITRIELLSYPNISANGEARIRSFLDDILFLWSHWTKPLNSSRSRCDGPPD